MTRGRFLLGLGPGALPSHAAMIGLDMPQTRELLEDAVEIITHRARRQEEASDQAEGQSQEVEALSSAEEWP
jgi:limonene 1,2-monooxygenase